MVEYKAECLKDELEEKRRQTVLPSCLKRSIRSVIPVIIGETFAVYPLGRVATWKQLFTDGT
eukprot:10151015-Ditylum_brightwellii.AAC.1